MADELNDLRARLEGQAKQIAALDRAVREMKALARGPQGADGRDGKDGKDGRDGRDGKVEMVQQAAPVVKLERAPAQAWRFETDGAGHTVARPLGPQ